MGTAPRHRVTGSRGNRSLEPAYNISARSHDCLLVSALGEDIYVQLRGSNVARLHEIYAELRQ